jgi:succinate dehydrogenase / fumarate reductase, cytochrome b subunit
VVGDVYHNVIRASSRLVGGRVYIAANLLLAIHLYHGLWSLFQTFGWDHPASAWPGAGSRWSSRP